MTRALPLAGAALLWVLARVAAHPGAWQPLWTLAFDLALLAALWWVALGAGHRVVRHVEPAALEWPGSVVLATVVGCGLLATGLFALGLAGLYRPPLLAGLLLAAALLVGHDSRQALRGQAARWRAGLHGLATVEDWVVAACLALMAGTFAFVGSRIPLPLHDWDALAYHQVGVRLYLAAGAMIPLPHIGAANGPINTELLFLVGAAFGTDTFGQAVVWGQSLLAACLVVALAARYWGRLAGWIAGATYVAIPMVPYFSATPYNDMGLLLGEVSTLAGLVALSCAPTRRGAVVVGLLAGFTLGQKMSALPFGAAVAVAAVILFLHGRSMRQAVVSLVTAGVVALLVALPWYVRNAVWFANPFMPLALGAVASSNLDPTMTGAVHVAPSSTLPARVLGALGLALSVFINWISPLTLLAPCAVVVRPRRIALAFTAAALIGYLYWLRYTPWNLPPRYLLCWVAPLAVPVGALVATLGRRLGRPPLLLLCVLPVLLEGLISATVELRYATLDGALTYLAGQESRDQYLAHRVAPYRAGQVLNAVDRDQPVALLGDARTYYLRAPVLPDWGATRLGALKAAGTPEHAAGVLWAEGARYVFAVDAILPPTGNGDPWAARLRGRYLVPLGRAGGYSVYRLRPVR